MNKGFDWVPFYDEMAKKLLAYRGRQLTLIKILKSAGVNGLIDQNPRGKAVPLTEIDPFTFLALLNKQSFAERARILAIVQSQLSLITNVPHEFLGIPKADARQTWLFPYLYDRNPDDINRLWDLYEAVMSGKRISESVFTQAQEVKYTGHAKLTQAIFRAAPRRFFPVDGQTTSYLAGLRLPNEFRTAREFQDICFQVKKKVAKPLYEQSHDAWLANQKKEPSAETEYQKKALEKAAKPHHINEGKGGVAVPKIGKAGLSKLGYQRDPAVAAKALQLANFKCEIDADHQTFISSATGTPYVEAHHLIPFSNQGGYSFSLDVTANIVALCPNCHRRLHHGESRDKTSDIISLLSKRDDRLIEKKLRISKKELLKLYRGDLSEENA
ncbi:HNH endonuclease [Burkholderia pseudomultivorans]|uniref:HNH endonuclease n=1 Tax=Burkholderia pseudomultivorans TaxID=1207504 RepID=UPI0028753A1A|nr:HNH endonuclease [Burkholderia pseudomultivorans]MDS0858499.1 HNH endonuclease [Burkholderia pseudomultivorans]